MIAGAFVAAEETDPFAEVFGTIVAVVVFAFFIMAVVTAIVFLALFISRKARAAQTQIVNDQAAQQERAEQARRRAQALALAASVPPGTRCPNCNAPLELDLDGTCHYCRQRWAGAGSGESC